MIFYSIKKWDKLYEVAQGRPCKTMKWVAIPNIADTAYSYIKNHPRKVELYAAFILLLRLASAMPDRGQFIDNLGNALEPVDIARLTDFPVEIFEMAIEYLLEINVMQKTNTRS